VPNELTSELKIFSKLDLKVNVINLDIADMDEGQGWTYFDESEFIVDERFGNDVKMIVSTYIEQGYFYDDTLISTLFHELNHKIEQMHRMKSGQYAIGQMHRQYEFENEIFTIDGNYFQCSQEN